MKTLSTSLLFIISFYFSNITVAQLIQQGPKLVSNDYSVFGSHGASVGISVDGNTVLFGGPKDNLDKGAAWIFTRSNGVWTQEGSVSGVHGLTVGARAGSGAIRATSDIEDRRL